MTGAMTYVLKHDLFWPNGTLWKAAGSVVGLYDRINGKLVTDLDNWVNPDTIQSVENLVHGVDAAPPGWTWKENDGSVGDWATGMPDWILVRNADAPTTPDSSRWNLTADEQAKKDAMKAYALKQKKQRQAAEQQQKVTTMIGAPVRPPIQPTAPRWTPKNWMPKGIAGYGKNKGGGRNI